MFTIEKSVKMPTKVGRTATNLYPFDKMELGDSFMVAFVAKEKDLSDAEYTKYKKNLGIGLSTSANSWIKRSNSANSHRFTVRTQESGVRIWRIEAKVETTAKAA